MPLIEKLTPEEATYLIDLMRCKCYAIHCKQLVGAPLTHEDEEELSLISRIGAKFERLE